MGLDTTHDAWHGPYSKFARWRRALAEAAGMPELGDIYGHQNGNDPAYVTFAMLKPDDIHLLLDHSDCDGVISPEDAEKIAHRLEELLSEPALQEEDWQERTKQFIEGARLAFSLGEQIQFH